MNEVRERRTVTADREESLPSGSGRGGEDDRLVEVVRAAAEGDEAAWETLVDRFSGLIFSVTNRYRMSAADAAEVSQTTWLRLAENLHRNRIRDPARVGAWLATTAGRECARVIRSWRRQIPTDGAYFLEVADTDAQLDAGLLGTEQKEVLQLALSALPVRNQVLIRLLFGDRPASYDEIVAATGLKKGSIGPTRARCLAELRKHLRTWAGDRPGSPDQGEGPGRHRHRQGVCSPEPWGSFHGDKRIGVVSDGHGPEHPGLRELLRLERPNRDGISHASDVAVSKAEEGILF